MSELMTSRLPPVDKQRQRSLQSFSCWWSAGENGSDQPENWPDLQGLTFQTGLIVSVTSFYVLTAVNVCIRPLVLHTDSKL